ncbi:hypothetical protein ACFWGI_35445 [Streptomyces niveus]|uniref:hypothetical protein n=1 Tax=Streptomyces niveus TaxID=193462 RepID=UPI0036527CF2
MVDDEAQQVTHTVYVYPEPGDGLPWCEIFEVSLGEDQVISDTEIRDHPEAPLSDEERDAVLSRLLYRRTGPWARDNDDESASAPVVAELPGAGA